jgi:hypothetical protein
MAGSAKAHLHDEVELERVEKGFVLGAHAQSSLHLKVNNGANITRA